MKRLKNIYYDVCLRFACRQKDIAAISSAPIHRAE